MYYLGDKRFEMRDMDLGKPGPDEVLVKIGACGVCGTDVHIYHGEKGSADVKPPVVLGHEFAGIVEAVGERVDTLKPGDHVSVDPNIYCGKCDFCRIGKKQHCENLMSVGVMRDGWFADYCLFRETQFLVLNPAAAVAMRWMA